MITKETRRESYEAILPKITDRLVLDDAGAEKCTQWTEPTFFGQWTGCLKCAPLWKTKGRVTGRRWDDDCPSR